MVFSSLVFISVFLPAVLLLYWLLPSAAGRNILLLAASLFFYAYGEPYYVFLMAASAFFHYACALWIERHRAQGRIIVTAAVMGNLVLLCIFKYGALLGQLGIPVPRAVLPAGISFFTFQAMSYVIDVYRREVRPQKNFLYVLLYISLFPQLIAGPIVKYHDVEQELDSRSLCMEDAARGIRRFIAGMGKKVLIANYMGEIADALFAAPMAQINMAGAWLGAAAYMLQIYFDFSGYSDMAMGLGHMFHIQLPMNFNSPYKSCSVKELWQRWHMTLSRFFITYVYIPLGGSKKGKARTIFNTMAIFALSGLWHGANWTYVAWGVMQGLLVVWDNLGIIGIRGTTEKNPARFYIPRWLGWFFTFSFFNLSLFFFRSESMAYAFQMFKNLFSFRNTGYIYKLAANMDVPEFYIFKQAITMLAPDILNVAYIVLLLLMLAASAFILTRKNALQMVESTDYDSRFCWFITIIFIWSLISFSQVSTFIYFNF